MDIKKKQHYVWKQYLKQWTDNGKHIYFVHKNTDEVKSANLENVAQKRFFYEVDSFTEVEESLLTYMINDWSTDYSRESNLALLKTFFTYSRYVRRWERLEFPEKEHKLNVVKKNTLENLHSMFEKFGERILKIKSHNDLSIFDDDKERLKALMYLCIQYTRTNQMYNQAICKSSIISVLPESSLKIIAVTLAITLAANLTLAYTLKVTLLKNSSNVDFITTDQPIINLYKVNDPSSSKEELLEFYYPIGPKMALLIATSNDKIRHEIDIEALPFFKQ